MKTINGLRSWWVIVPVCLVTLGLLCSGQTRAIDVPRSAPVNKQSQPTSTDVSKLKLSDQAIASIRATKIENRLAALEKESRQQIRDLKNQNVALQQTIAAMRTDIDRLQKSTQGAPSRPGYSRIEMALNTAIKSCGDSALCTFWVPSKR